MLLLNEVAHLVGCWVDYEVRILVVSSGQEFWWKIMGRFWGVLTDVVALAKLK